jgi:hypothetical protein
MTIVICRVRISVILLFLTVEVTQSTVETANKTVV